VRASPAINSDETRVRIDGRNWWHWLFQVATASYYVIAPSRGTDVVMNFLGKARPEVWGSDSLPTQFAAPASQHQLCLAHQIHILAYAVEADGPAGTGCACELLHVLSRAPSLYPERGPRRSTLQASPPEQLDNVTFRSGYGQRGAGVSGGCDVSGCG
jgi:hypothetical protein